ncbi:MAG: DUF2807 domain-containing protein, partial [Dysgonamonadaceae bacterium]|nr:DUF2807 domain-containing protein [Dysgonamonadaceae bacterium]
ATSFWIIPVYLIAWLILPEAYSAERKLQMRGKPITVENIGKTVAEGVDAEKKKGQQGCLSFLIGFLKVSLISLGIVIGIPLLILFVLIIFFLVLLLGIGKDYSLFLDSILDFSVNPLILIVIISCIIGIPIITFIYMCIARLLNLKPLHKGVRWTGLIIWIIALISLFFVKLSPYVRSDFHSVDIIEGNGVIEEKEMIFPLIEKIKMRDINVNVQIEQIKEGDDSVLISGDSNLLEYLQLKNDDGLLEIRSSTRKPYKPTVPSIVRVRSKNINELTLKSLGNINLPQAFYGDELQINMEGAGMITADSLYVQKLNVKSEGIGSVTLVGQTKNATFDVEGAGIIRAFDLGVDSVRAQLDGVGSIQCNPSLYLDGTVDGIGEIVYTQEPKSKNISFSGMGKIGLH